MATCGAITCFAHRLFRLPPQGITNAARDAPTADRTNAAPQAYFVGSQRSGSTGARRKSRRAGGSDVATVQCDRQSDRRACRHSRHTSLPVYAQHAPLCGTRARDEQRRTSDEQESRPVGRATHCCAAVYGSSKADPRTASADLRHRVPLQGIPKASHTQTSDARQATDAWHHWQATHTRQATGSLTKKVKPTRARHQPG